MRGSAALLLAGGLAAQDVVVERLDGTKQDWSLTAIHDGVLSGTAAGDGSVVRLALQEVAAIQFVRNAPEDPPPAAPGQLWLRSGASFHGTLLGGSERTLRFRPVFGGEPVDLPVRHLRAVRLDEADVPGFREALARRSASDVLFARSGDDVSRLGIEFDRFASDRIVVRFQSREQELPLARVHGLVFGERSGAATDPIPGTHVVADCAGAEALIGRLVELADGHLRLELGDRVTLSIPLASLRWLRVQSDALRFLSDLQPQVEQTPAFDRVWPWHNDRAHAGGAIQLGGQQYERGVAVIPRTRLTYVLGGGYDWFGAVVGLEDRAGPHAHAILRIRGDGRLLFDSGGLGKGAEPKTLKLPLGGVQQLVLEADFGERFDLGDHCVFASARVWRERKD